VPRRIGASNAIEHDKTGFALDRAEGYVRYLLNEAVECAWGCARFHARAQAL